MELGVNDSTKLWINPSGNIGIGTNTPGMPLDVYANIPTGSVARVFNQHASSNTVALQAVNAGPGGAIQVGGSGNPISEIKKFSASAFNCGGGAVSGATPFSCSGTNPYTLPAGATFASITCSGINASIYASGTGVINGGTLYINGVATGSGTFSATTFTCMAVAFP
jgi:hypothetical protein